MVAPKLVKLAVTGAVVAAVAIGIGVGIGVHKKRSIDAAAASKYDDCRRFLVVPGMEEEITKPQPIRRKLGQTGVPVVASSTAAPSTMDNAWYGDAHAHTPAASINKSSSKGLKASKGPKGTYGGLVTKGTSVKGLKASKEGKSSGLVTKGSSLKGPKGTSTKTKGTKTKGVNTKGASKAPKGSKTKAIPVRHYSFLFILNSCMFFF